MTTLEKIEDLYSRIVVTGSAEGIAERGGSFIHDGMRFTMDGGTLKRSMI